MKTVHKQQVSKDPYCKIGRFKNRMVPTLLICRKAYNSYEKAISLITSPHQRLDEKMKIIQPLRRQALLALARKHITYILCHRCLSELSQRNVISFRKIKGHGNSKKYIADR